MVDCMTSLSTVSNRSKIAYLSWHLAPLENSLALFISEEYRQKVASFPGHSQILSRNSEFSTQLRDKIWEWPGNELGRKDRRKRNGTLSCDGFY